MANLTTPASGPLPDSLARAPNSSTSRPSQERARSTSAGFNWRTAAEGQQTWPSVTSAVCHFQVIFEKRVVAL